MQESRDARIGCVWIYRNERSDRAFRLIARLDHDCRRTSLFELGSVLRIGEKRQRTITGIRECADTIDYAIAVTV
jgi:hypothetical protein